MEFPAEHPGQSREDRTVGNCKGEFTRLLKALLATTDPEIKHTFPGPIRAFHKAVVGESEVHTALRGEFTRFLYAAVNCRDENIRRALRGLAGALKGLVDQ